MGVALSSGPRRFQGAAGALWLPHERCEGEEGLPPDASDDDERGRVAHHQLGRGPVGGAAGEGGRRKLPLKANALKNRSVMAKLNPGAAQRQKMRALAMKEGTKERKALLEKKRATAADAKKHSKGAKEFYKHMMAAYEVKAADAEDEE